MRVPDVVIEALMRDEGLTLCKPLYLLASAAEPKSMSELARLAGMSRMWWPESAGTWQIRLGEVDSG